MNSLDDLISSSARVPDATAESLGRARSVLDAAIAAETRGKSPAARKAAARWFGFSGGGLRGPRGKLVIGSVAGVAALAAAAAVITVPSSSPRPASSLAGVPAKPSVKAPTVKAQPKPSPSGQDPDTPFTYSISATKVTAAYVFAQAAKGAQASQYTPQGDVQLVNGWPKARYWHTVTELTSTGCPDQVTRSDVWLGKDGSEMVTNRTTGRAVSVNHAQCGEGPTDDSTYPVGNVPPGPFIGGQLYTWAQFAQMPTDPEKLWPFLQADSTVGVAPYKGVPEQDWLFQTILIALEQDPLSTAMRVALLTDAEKISGVRVVGQYTDSLGRTGVAIRQGVPDRNTGTGDTIVIDTANGQVLADIQPTPAHQGCTSTKEPGGGTSTSCAFGGATLFISANATNTEPHTNQPTPFLGDPSASAEAVQQQKRASGQVSQATHG